MKCPTCHVEFASSAGFHAHVPNCAYKNKPLPELVIDISKPLNRMNKTELLAYAESQNIAGATEDMTKAKIVALVEEVIDLRELAEMKKIGGADQMTKEQLIKAIEEAEAKGE